MFIKSLSGFAYVEPNGKDSGINVRKKVESIVALLNDKEKIQAVRNKAAANRDKYIGLSSSGITYKSSASPFGSSSYQSNDRYGGFGSTKEGDSFNDSYRDGESKWSNDKKNVKSKEGLSNEKVGSKLKKGGAVHARGHDSLSEQSSKTVIKPGQISSSNGPSVQPSSEDDFDDFDPRGSSTANNTTTNQVNLFGESLVGDLMDAPASASTETASPEVDLFADATFVSASPHKEATTGSLGQGDIDFFTSSPDIPAAAPTNVDLFAASDFGVASKEKSFSPVITNTEAFDPFAASDSGAPSEVKSSASEPTGTKSFDPFAGIPINNFEGGDPFGAFTSHTEEATSEPPKNFTNNSLNNLGQTSVASSKPTPKKDGFQVKSGIWADSLSRGLIDLNITAPKKTNLADIGIVGGLGEVSDDKEKATPPTAFYMGTAMGAGSGLGRSGFPSSTMGGSGSFSSFPQQQYGSFK
ncbi:clathrin interactor EPSIN 1-like isoform X1 [Iris pallida]|uniref:Clathrin interactor EPSIN 1-like isoform X1 n=1 Tax=Iris pallida TaxID=29817 RepID=A0AAX6FA71_IRIPA|nr:clathrin interactor EPSIN 1-like isoform X1 [Iris pallida]